MRRPSRTERQSAGEARPRQAGRTTAVGPGDRRDGQALIFGWGSHLTRAEKQRYRERFVLAGGIFVFLLVAGVIGWGALQQYFFRPRTSIAKVNTTSIERQWYDKNLAYDRFVLQHRTQDAQTLYQALVANQHANADATATAGPQPSATPAASAAPSGANQLSMTMRRIARSRRAAAAGPNSTLSVVANRAVIRRRRMPSRRSSM